MKRPIRNDYFDKYDTLNEFVFKARLEDYHFDLEKYVDYLEERNKILTNIESKNDWIDAGIHSDFE